MYSHLGFTHFTSIIIREISSRWVYIELMQIVWIFHATREAAAPKDRMVPLTQSVFPCHQYDFSKSAASLPREHGFCGREIQIRVLTVNKV